MQPRHADLADYIRRKTLRRGAYHLVSGRTSNYYLDGKMASFDGEGLSLIVQAIIAELEGIASSAIGGMDIGATPIVAGVALRMEQLKKPYPAFVVRKSCEKIEGPIPPAPCNVVVVDDVVTSGGSILQAIDALEAAGYRVVLAIGVVDRDAGGREALGARAIPYQPLVTLSDLGLKNED